MGEAEVQHRSAPNGYQCVPSVVSVLPVVSVLFVVSVLSVN